MGKNAVSRSQFYYAWKKNEARPEFTTGVSLHGHTQNSHESLGFLPGAFKKIYVLPRIARWAEGKYQKKWKNTFDYELGYWTSPVSSEAAYALESKQITDEGLMALVSITDHDEIAGCDGIVSLEWTAPYDGSVFHVGIHNLPRSVAPEMLAKLRAITAQPGDSRRALHAALAEIGALPGTLIVLNHPFVDQGRIGQEIHESVLKAFMKENHAQVNAFEVNALQPAAMNDRVVAVANELGLPLISGGDRHGFEPNGAINLTNARTFSDFVSEVREDKKSDILFMPQYRRPVAPRYAENVRAIMAEYPELGVRARWHDRVFYECPDGITRSLTELAGGDSRKLKAVNWLIAGSLGVAVRGIVAVRG